MDTREKLIAAIDSEWTLAQWMINYESEVIKLKATDQAMYRIIVAGIIALIAGKSLAAFLILRDQSIYRTNTGKCYLCDNDTLWGDAPHKEDCYIHAIEESIK